MTLELNIQAALLDGYHVETHDNRLFFLVRDAWRRGPYTSERDAWRHGGIPDYSGSKIEALKLAQRVGVEIDATVPSPWIVQAVLDSVRVIEDAPEFVQDDTLPSPDDVPKGQVWTVGNAFADMTRAELRAAADARGIAWANRTTKQELIDSLIEWNLGDNGDPSTSA